MRPEDLLLIHCARQRFGAADVERVRALAEVARPDYGRLYDVARDHRLAPLVFKNLGYAVDLPADVVARADADKVSNAVLKAERRRKLGDLLDLLERGGVPTLLIKGEALDHTVYEKPWYTASADIDLVLMARKEDADPRTVARLGEVLPTVPFIETNWRDHHDVTMNRILPIDFDAVARDAASVTIEGRDVRVPCREDALLFAAINSCRKKFFRLKSLCDIAEIVRADEALEWDRFLQRARAARCPGIAYTALWVTRSLTGCDVPDRVFRALDPGPVRAAVVRYLSKRLSFSSLDRMRDGLSNRPRRYKGSAILLPYASFSLGQALRNAVGR